MEIIQLNYTDDAGLEELEKVRQRSVFLTVFTEVI